MSIHTEYYQGIAYQIDSETGEELTAEEEFELHLGSVPTITDEKLEALKVRLPLEISASKITDERLDVKTLDQLREIIADHEETEITMNTYHIQPQNSK